MNLHIDRSINPVSLYQEKRATLPTSEAAFHLNRAQQTLRVWAMRENGPIRPIRLNGRLAWSVNEIKRLLAVPEVNYQALEIEKHSKPLAISNESTSNLNYEGGKA